MPRETNLKEGCCQPSLRLVALGPQMDYKKSFNLRRAGIPIMKMQQTIVSHKYPSSYFFTGVFIQVEVRREGTF